MNFIPIGDLPALHAERHGGTRWAVRHGHDVLSWGELDRRSTRRAWALKAAGVVKDDLVTLALPNGSAFIELTFALWKLGATPHVVSWRLPPAELKSILEVARPRLLIAADAALAPGALPGGFGISEGADEPLKHEIAAHWKAMSSGGSTGRPKIIIDHMPGVFDPETPYLHVPRDGVVLNPGPLYHNAPFSFTQVALFKGNSVVSMVKFDAAEAMRLIADHGVEWVNLVPTMMQRMWRLKEIGQAPDLSSLKHVWHMAAPMPVWLKEAWIDWLGPEVIWELYGGTERQGSTIISGTEWLAHKGSVGRPAGCKVKIVGEDGEELPFGEIGEIFLLPDAGVGSTYHYLGAEARAQAGGWESLGDFGRLDEDGYLYIADRRTDLILSGGANIYPAEIEGALMEHPLVEVAVVIGLPHEDLGAAAHAIIKSADPARSPTEPQLLAFLEERLVRYKIPRSFEFTTAELRDDAGKVRRTRLRDERLRALDPAS